MTVIDASVAVKWFLPEPGEDAAQQVLAAGEELTAPSLIRVEVTAAILRKARFKEIEEQEAQMTTRLWFQALVDGLVTLVPDEADLPEAVRVALALKHPLQDCLYLAVAKRLGAPLITADQKFAAKASAAYPNVRVLAGC